MATNSNQMSAPYSIDDAILNKINGVNTHLTSGFCDTNTNILTSDQRTIDQLNASLDRKSIANDLHNYNNTRQILENDNRNAGFNLASTERNGSSNLIAAERIGGQNISAIERSAAFNMAAIERTSGENMRATERGTNQTLNAVDRNGAQNLSTLERRTGEILVGNERIVNQNQHIFSNLSREHSLQHTENIRGMDQIRLEMCKLDNNLSKDILKSNADVKSQASDYFRQTQVDSVRNHEKLLNKLCKMESKLELQAEKNTASMQLEALRNRSDILCKIDSCCCELKHKIDTSEHNVLNMMKCAEMEKLRNANLLLEFKNSNRCGRRGDSDGGCH